MTTGCTQSTIRNIVCIAHLDGRSRPEISIESELKD
ncbi:hypothetical protein Hjap01_02748 [Haloarcula japonica]